MHISGKTLFTGGKDELIRVYDINRKVSKGGLGGLEGSLNKFMESEKYLFASYSYGKIGIFGIADQELYTTMKCHPGNILDYDIHPSGRILVSTGTDKKVKLWNLTNLKESYHKNFGKQLDFVRFAPDDNLLLGVDENLTIFNTTESTICAVLEHEARITCIQVYNPLELLIVSGKLKNYFQTMKYLLFRRQGVCLPKILRREIGHELYQILGL